MLMFFQNSERRMINEANDKNQPEEEVVNVEDGKKPLGALELYSDPEMENFFTKGIRGGQSFISQRYATGNSDPEKEGHHMLYIDGNYFLLRFFS